MFRKYIQQQEGHGPLKPLAEFHIDARYDGRSASSRSGLGAHAADMGLSASEIRAAIVQARATSPRRVLLDASANMLNGPLAKR